MHRPIVVALLASALLTLPLEAQRGGGGGRSRGAPPAAMPPTFTMPTAARIREQANVADLLVEKRKKLGLDAAAVDSLKHLAEAINARNAPHLAAYDSLRSRMRAAMSSGGAPGTGGAGGPGAGGPGGPGSAPDAPRGERMNPIRESMRVVQTGREADIPLVLALVPAEKQEQAKKLIDDQGEELQKSLSPRAPGGAGGRPPRP